MIDLLVGIPLLIVLWSICALMVVGVYNLIMNKDGF